MKHAAVLILTALIFSAGCQNVHHVSREDAGLIVSGLAAAAYAKIQAPEDIPALAAAEYDALPGKDKVILNWYYGNRQAVVSVVVVTCTIEYVKARQQEIINQQEGS